MKEPVVKMEVVYCKGMVSIDSNIFSYANIDNMYKGNKDGIGLQVVVEDLSEEEAMQKMCDKITSAVREFAGQN